MKFLSFALGPHQVTHKWSPAVCYFFNMILPKFPSNTLTFQLLNFVGLYDELKQNYLFVTVPPRRRLATVNNTNASFVYSKEYSKEYHREQSLHDLKIFINKDFAYQFVIHWMIIQAFFSDRSWLNLCLM